ncbi:MAG: hypothetical protein ACE5RP_06775, partial [Nitrosopumilus sp.]
MSLKMWADYLISEVSYDSNHLILQAKRHQELENGISKGDLVDRIKITSDISNGLSYITIYDRISTWKKGNKIRFFRIGGQPYLRIDKNKVSQDYLGDIREIKSTQKLKQKVTQEPEEATPEQIARLEQLEKQIAELESQPAKEPEPEEATPEQIARLEQLEK